MKRAFSRWACAVTIFAANSVLCAPPPIPDEGKALLLGTDTAAARILFRKLDDGPILWVTPTSLGTKLSVEPGHHNLSVMCDFTSAGVSRLSPGNVAIDVEAAHVYDVVGSLDQSGLKCVVRVSSRGAANQPGSAGAESQPVNARSTLSADSQSIKSVGCVDIASLAARNTPAEILPGVRKCIDDHDYARGVRLFAVADVYGRFDTLRVVDVSAHAAIPALESAYLGQVDRDSIAKFQASLKEITDSSSKLGELCTQVRALGPPTYSPTYMTLHGMSAFTGQGGGLKRDFDRSAAWESALKSVLRCPLGR